MRARVEKVDVLGWNKSKDPRLMGNDNSYSKYVPVGVLGYLQDEYKNSSRMAVILPSLTFLFLK